jgi:hypothetical protein
VARKGLDDSGSPARSAGPRRSSATINRAARFTALSKTNRRRLVNLSAVVPPIDVPRVCRFSTLACRWGTKSDSFGQNRTKSDKARECLGTWVGISDSALRWETRGARGFAPRLPATDGRTSCVELGGADGRETKWRRSRGVESWSPIRLSAHWRKGLRNPKLHSQRTPRYNLAFMCRVYGDGRCLSTEKFKQKLPMNTN